MVPRIAIPRAAVIEEVFDRQVRGIALVPKRRMIRKATGAARLQLHRQALAVAAVGGDERVRQVDGAAAGTAVQLDDAVMIAIVTDHVEVEIAHHLRAGVTQRRRVNLTAPVPLLLA